MQWRARNKILLALSPFVKKSRVDIVHTHAARDHAVWSVMAGRENLKHIWHERDATNIKSAGRFSRKSTLVVVDPLGQEKLTRAASPGRENIEILPRKISTASPGSSKEFFTSEYLSSIKGAYARVQLPVS